MNYTIEELKNIWDFFDNAAKEIIDNAVNISFKFIDDKMIKDYDEYIEKNNFEEDYDFNNFVNTDNIQKDEIEAGENYIIPPENSKFRIVVSPMNIDENSEIENIDSFYAVYLRRNQKWIVGQYFSGDGFKMASRNKVAEFTFKLKSRLKVKYEWQIEKIYLNVVSKLKDK